MPSNLDVNFRLGGVDHAMRLWLAFNDEQEVVCFRFRETSMGSWPAITILGCFKIPSFFLKFFLQLSIYAGDMDLYHSSVYICHIFLDDTSQFVLGYWQLCYLELSIVHALKVSHLFPGILWNILVALVLFESGDMIWYILEMAIQKLFWVTLLNVI